MFSKIAKSKINLMVKNITTLLIAKKNITVASKIKSKVHVWEDSFSIIQKVKKR